MPYLSRLQSDMEISRRVAIDRELQGAVEAEHHLSRIRQAQIDAEHEHYIRRDYAARIQAEAEEASLIAIRDAERREIEIELAKEQAHREAREREMQRMLYTQARHDEIKQQEHQLERRHIQDEMHRQKEVQVLVRAAENQKREGIRQEIERQNSLVFHEQDEQKRLERILRDINVEIGTIYDERELRRKREIEEYEVLDKECFALKQEIRGSQVRQKALEDSIAQLSKIMVCD